MGEALLRRRLDERGVPARVTSAGFLDDGVPATESAVEAVAAEGLDISEHRSRRVTPEMVKVADLVVTMTRQHLIELTLMAPDTWPKIFQARDLLRRAEQVGARQPDEPVADWLAALGQGRTRSGILTAHLSDDVADPIGQPAAAYKRTVQELDELFARLAALV